jgi:hypothetical protein
MAETAKHVAAVRHTSLILRLIILLLLFSPVLSAQDGAVAIDDDWGDDWDEEASAGMPLHGFFEAGYGGRLQNDPAVGRSTTLGEIRFRGETEYVRDRWSLAMKADLYADDVESTVNAQVRELAVMFAPAGNVDVKIGRQIMTWGTGDFLFLNDLFPKDFVSFFSGRDDEYLKAPSNSLRVSVFGKTVNLDLVWTPVFAPDDYLNGERFSFFSAQAGGIVAPDPPLAGKKPARDLANSELAARLYKTVNSVEYAAYLYAGFWKQPLGTSAQQVPFFPRLSVYGGSVRWPALSGLANIEIAYFDSRNDRSGADPMIPNSQLRLLFGYERELVARLSAGLQLYGEWTLHHGRLLQNSLSPQFEPKHLRTLLTTRLSYRDERDNWQYLLFVFFSPSDSDYYLRPQIRYRMNDSWSFIGGANLFGGDKQYTFFGQLEDNSNAFVRARYSF